MRSMSSPESAIAKAAIAKAAIAKADSVKADSVKAARVQRAAGKGAAKRETTRLPRPEKPTGKGESDSAQAKRLAAQLERALAAGQRNALSSEALQALMAAVCKTYAARV